METGLRILLLIVAALSATGCASVREWLDRDPPPAESTVESEQPADARAVGEDESGVDDGSSVDEGLIVSEDETQDPPPPRVIDPEVDRRQIKTPGIDTENIELGAYFGVLSIEDFGTNPVYGITAAYHLTEDFFFRTELGRSRAGETSFETLGGDVQLLTGDERRFTYYSVGVGYNFLPGEVFVGRGLAMSSTFYLIGGIGSTKFADDQRFMVDFGAGYRVLPTDWLAMHVGVLDRMVESDLLGSTKITHNLEVRVGATVFF